MVLLPIVVVSLFSTTEAVLSPEADFAVASTLQYKVYLGNLHAHSAFSDGTGTPAEAFAYARNQGGMDYMALTEHNHREADGTGPRRDGLLIGVDHSLYNGTRPDSVRSAANAATVNGRFVAIMGQEFSTISSGNHVNVFDAQEVIEAPNGKFNKLVNWLSAHPDSFGNPCVVQLNHPESSPGDNEYGRDDFGSDAAWVSNMDRYAQLIEVLGGPALTDGRGERPKSAPQPFYSYLSRGFHLSPTATQDNHYRTWGTITDARTGIVSRYLTRNSLIDGLRRGRTTASNDRDLRIICWMGKQLAGGTLARPSGALKVALRVTDLDEPLATYTVQVLGGKIGLSTPAVLATATFTGNSSAGKVWSIPGIHVPTDIGYVLLKVAQKDLGPVDNTWTAPVWFN